MPSLSWVMFHLAPCSASSPGLFVLTSACLACARCDRLLEIGTLATPYFALVPALAALAIGLIGLDTRIHRLTCGSRRRASVGRGRASSSRRLQHRPVPVGGGLLTAFPLLRCSADQASSPNTEPARATGSRRAGLDSGRARRSPRRRGASPCGIRLRRRPHPVATADDGP